MKVLVILEVDPDKVLDSYLPEEIITIEEAVRCELAFVEGYGISVREIKHADDPFFEDDPQLIGNTIKQEMK